MLVAGLILLSPKGAVTALSSNTWLGLPDGHVTCPVPGNSQPYIDFATAT